MDELGVLWMGALDEADEEMSEQLARRLLALEQDFADVTMEERTNGPEEREDEAAWLPLNSDDYLEVYEEQLRSLRAGYDWRERDDELLLHEDVGREHVREDNELDLLLLEQEYLQNDQLEWNNHRVREPDEWEGHEDSLEGTSEEERFRQLLRDAECEGCARRAALCFMWAWGQHGAAPLPRELAEMIGRRILRSGFEEPEAWVRARKLTRALALVRQAGFQVE